ncbi:MAG: DUF402 domain-containing protein [Clostridiaceae bacterium]|nr:DUF402 domain-containing protein [Clostridiaceae bacterium]
MPKIFRIRYIPSETVELSSDILLYRDNQFLITEWVPIKPRNDISNGISCVFLDNGWKISAMMDSKRKIIYWYCDVIDIEYNKTNDTYFLYDLLIDIKITDGRVEILDLDELAKAYEEKLISKEQVLMSLKRTDNLLRLAYKVNLPVYVNEIIRKLTGREC